MLTNLRNKKITSDTKKIHSIDEDMKQILMN